MLKKRAISVCCVLTSIFIFSVISTTSAAAQINQNEDATSEQFDESACQASDTFISVECEAFKSAKNIVEYWGRHCAGSLGRYTEEEEIPGVIFSDRFYFQSSGTLTHKTTSYEYEFELPAIAEDEVFILTEVWCIRSKFKSSSVEVIEYSLGDIEVYSADIVGVPSSSSVEIIEAGGKTSNLLHSHREIYSNEELEEELKSGGRYIALKNEFVENVETLIEFEVTTFGHIFPKDGQVQIDDIANLDIPTQKENSCSEPVGSLQCLIIDCVQEDENFFHLRSPFLSLAYTDLVPTLSPSANNQIVGFPTWMELVGTENFFSLAHTTVEDVKRVVEYSLKDDNTLRTYGEHFSKFSGELETCLSSRDSTSGKATLFPEQPPRVGFRVTWESRESTSANNCIDSVAVSDTLTPVCERGWESCLQDEKPDFTAEKDRPFTAVFLNCLWGTIYDMGERTDDSDQHWCGREEEFIPGNLVFDTPVHIRALTEVYSQYLRSCNYTYSRSSLDEPDGTFTVEAVRWRVIICWMANGASCGNWWFRTNLEFETVVREIQALESYR